MLSFLCKSTNPLSFSSIVPPFQVMLSAILVRLRQISTTCSSGESANEELLQIIPLLVSAHPDLEPKVVRTAFLSAAPPRDTDRHRHQRRTAYYRYLSLLLDVDEGIDSARSDRCLMEVSLTLDVRSGGRIEFIILPCLTPPFPPLLALLSATKYIYTPMTVCRSGAIYRLSYIRNLWTATRRVPSSRNPF